jgi:hypothetical protein
LLHDLIADNLESGIEVVEMRKDEIKVSRLIASFQIRNAIANQEICGLGVSPP